MRAAPVGGSSSAVLDLLELGPLNGTKKPSPRRAFFACVVISGHHTKNRDA